MGGRSCLIARKPQLPGSMAIREPPVSTTQLRTCGSPEIAHDRSFHLERVDRTGLAIENLSSRRDQEGVGDRARPFLVECLGELVAVVRRSG